MIKHVVMWKLKDEALGKTKKDHAIKIKHDLLNLKHTISELISIEVGIHFFDHIQGFDMVLITTFKNEKDMMIYQQNEAHQQVVKYIKEVTIDRVVVDFETE